MFNIVNVLKTDRDPNQAFRNSCGLPLFFGETAMGGGCRVRNGGFNVTQIGRDGEHLGVINHGPRPLPSTVHLKADDTPA